MIRRIGINRLYTQKTDYFSGLENSEAKTETPSTNSGLNRVEYEFNFLKDLDLLPKVSRCSQCAKLGHRSYECPEPITRKTCNNCNNIGHLARDCDRLIKPVYCVKCGSTGHSSKACLVDFLGGADIQTKLDDL